MVNCRGYFYCTGKNRGSCSGENGARLNIIEKNFLRAIYVYTGNIPAFIIEKRNNASHVFDFISASRRKLDRIKEAYETGVYTIEEYRSAKSRIEVEITELEGELSSIQKPGCFRELSLYELLTDELASFADISLVVRSFVRDITILGDTMTVNFYA